MFIAIRQKTQKYLRSEERNSTALHLSGPFRSSERRGGWWCFDYKHVTPSGVKPIDSLNGEKCSLSPLNLLQAQIMSSLLLIEFFNGVAQRGARHGCRMFVQET